MTLNVLLADDHTIVRDGLKALINSHANMQVVADAQNGREALEMARQHKPDLIIMDVRMPDLNGIEATRLILRDLPDTRVIALSIYATRQFVSAMFNAGAMAYLVKDGAFEELEKAVHAVFDKHEKYISPKLNHYLGGHILSDRKTVDKDNVYHVLTDRERQVLQLMSEGKSTRDIARICEISSKTVETHRKHVMEKLNLHTLAELTKYAIREGLTTL